MTSKQSLYVLRTLEILYIFRKHITREVLFKKTCQIFNEDIHSSRKVTIQLFLSSVPRESTIKQQNTFYWHGAFRSVDPQISNSRRHLLAFLNPHRSCCCLATFQNEFHVTLAKRYYSCDLFSLLHSFISANFFVDILINAWPWARQNNRQ